MQGDTVKLRSRWAFLPGGEVGEDVAVDCAAGRIVRVGRPRGGETDLGDRLLLPGMVNAHVHLELSGFPALSTDGGFARWALRVGVRRARTDRAELASAAARAVDALVAEGVSCIGEVATSGAAAEALAERPVCGVWYQEMIDPSWLTAGTTCWLHRSLRTTSPVLCQVQLVLLVSWSFFPMWRMRVECTKGMPSPTPMAIGRGKGI